jgi:hypothetical protein
MPASLCVSAPVDIMDETGRGHEGGILDHQDVLPRDLWDQRTQVYFVDIFPRRVRAGEDSW